MRTLLFKICVITLGLAINAKAVEYSSVELDGKKITICKVNIQKERLELLHRDESGAPFKRFNKLSNWIETKGHKLLFAMNAGMYHSDFTAVGLFISDGKQATELNTSEGHGNFFLKPNGVFMVSKKGARVIDASEYPTSKDEISIATQSGPLLVKDGEIHPAFKPNSDSRHIRNGVGVASPDTAIFAISEEPLNFYDFARLFRDTLHCRNALYFDGTVSSLYSTELKRNDSHHDLGPIIAVIE
jgi:uncharacterized protein YigE (DUF2233 family)